MKYCAFGKQIHEASNYDLRIMIIFGKLKQKVTCKRRRSVFKINMLLRFKRPPNFASSRSFFYRFLARLKMQLV